MEFAAALRPRRMGATAVEYGLVAAGISVAIIAILNTLSGQLKSAFSDMLKSAG